MSDQKRYKVQTGTTLELSNELLESCFPYVELTRDMFDEIFNRGREAEFHASINFKRNSDEYEMLISDRRQELLKKYDLTEEKE